MAATSPVKLLNEQEALKQFYEARGFAPVWYDESGPTRAALLVMNELERATTWGLKADDFTLSAMAKASGPRSADDIATADYELSSVILKYARYASGGRISDPEARLSDYIDRRAPLPAPNEVLATVSAAADPAAALLSYHPQHEQFQKLHELYVKLSGSNPDQPKVNIARQGPMLVPGAKGPEVAALRQRLGVATGDGASDVFDNALASAVKAFQKANRLYADGLVGPKTRLALQKEDDGDKLQAIVATMEQWRWMPRDLGARHVLVNIPAYSIDFVDGGKSALSERVIVGKPETPTPVFSKSMSSIVLKPSWSLPDSIKREKLLAASRRGGSLEGEGLIVKKGSKTVKSWSVDWSKANLSHYTIYQPSGDGNALGSVKFLFPNKFSVYLHDTPNKSLFEASDRNFSHGCIRLRNPLKVAQFVLDWDQPDTFDVKRLSNRGPDNNEITLQKPLPMHIGYFTVWVNEDGEVNYYGDPYGHVERVTLALAGKWDAIDKGPRHNTEAGGSVVANLSGGGDDEDSRPSARSRPAVAGTSIYPPPMGLLGVPSPAPSKAKAIAVSAPAPKSKYKAGYVSDLMNSAFAR